MVDDPLGTLVEQGGAGVDEDLLVVADCLVPFSRILPAAVVEKASAD